MRSARARNWLVAPILPITILATGLLSACSPSSVDSYSTAPAIAPDALAGTAQMTPPGNPLIPATAFATEAATGPARLTIRIWWPSEVYPEAGSSAATILQSQLDSYRQNSGQNIEVRVKPSDGVGGIFQTLRSGNVAAPAAMPDLVLLQRSDLIQAVAGTLIQPIDPSALGTGNESNDIYPAAVALGQVNGIQYGLPYALAIDHFVYRVLAYPSPPSTASALLNAVQPVLFPAGTAKGVNATLLSQYLAAGGRVADDKGGPVLDKDALQSVLQFYEQAAAAKVVGPMLVDFTSAETYWPTFVQGKSDVAEVNSTFYLHQRGNLTGVAVLPLLPISGNAVTSLDGWLWAITTGDPQRQLTAENALAWLMQPQQQAAFTEAVGELPSRHSALAAWKDQTYAAFADSILSARAIPAADQIDPAVAKALQKAFEDVLSGRKRAEAASSDAAASVGSAAK